MLAIEFEKCGSPLDVLQIVERDLPEPRVGEVRVRMICSPVNPSDCLYVQGNYTSTPAFPQVVGFEGLGVVEASGGGFRGRLFQGKRVVVINQRGGTWAETAIVPDSQVVPVPQSLSDTQAATSFVNPISAWMMVQRVLQVPRGGWLIQSAAGSILGRMVIRLGRHFGFRTINVVRSKNAADQCHEAGAEHVIQWHADTDSIGQLRDQVASMIGKAELMSAIDAVSGETGAAILHCLAPKGRFLAYGTLSGQSLPVPTRQMMSQQWTIDSFWLGHRMQSLNLIAKLAVIKKVQKLVQAGILKTPVAEVFPLSEFQSALRMVENPRLDGRVLLSMS